MNNDDEFGDFMSELMVRSYFAKIGGEPYSEAADRYVKSAFTVVDFLSSAKEHGSGIELVDELGISHELMDYLSLILTSVAMYPSGDQIDSVLVPIVLLLGAMYARGLSDGLSSAQLADDLGIIDED